MRKVVEIRGPVLTREETITPSGLRKMRKGSLITLANELGLPIWSGSGYFNDDLTKADLIQCIIDKVFY